VQGFSHLLAAICKPIDASKLVSHIFARLGAEYDLLLTSVTTRQYSISLNDLYGYLLSYELRLEHHKSTVDLNITTAQRHNPSYARNNHGYGLGYRNNFPSGRGRGRGPSQHFSSYGSLHSAQHVKYVTNKATQQPHASSGLIKHTKLTHLSCMPTWLLPTLH